MSDFDHDDSADAWALLALKDPSNSPFRVKDAGGQALAKIRGKEFEFLVRNSTTIIGRNSSTQGNVDIHLGNSSFISRAHVEILFEKSRFFLKCNGKNGIFLDGHFQRKSAPPVEMPKTWVLKFLKQDYLFYFCTFIEFLAYFFFKAWLAIFVYSRGLLSRQGRAAGPGQKFTRPSQDFVLILGRQS